MNFLILLLIISVHNYGMEIEKPPSTVSAKKRTKLIECFRCNKEIYKSGYYLHLHRKHFNKNHECFKCNKTFGTIADYTSHMRSVEGISIRNTDLICSTCNAHLKTFERYLSHCAIVQHANNRQKEYNRHSRSQSKTFLAVEECPFCGQEYKHKCSTGFKYHLHNVHFNSENKCFTCNIRHDSCNEYTDHCKLQHNITLHNNKTIICPTCNTQLDSLDHFKKHSHDLTPEGRREAYKKRQETKKVWQRMSIDELTKQ